MAWLFQVNLEPLLLDVVNEQISKMSENNYRGRFPDDYYPDTDAFENNFKFGFLTLVALGAYFESFLSSIFFETYPSAQKKKAHFLDLRNANERLKFLMNPNDYSELVSTDAWKRIDTARKIRNSLVHYNHKISNTAGWADIFEWKVKSETIGCYFTRANFFKVLGAYKSVSQIICNKLQVEIYPAQFIHADGHTGICGYVFKPSLVEQETLDEIQDLKKNQIQYSKKKPWMKFKEFIKKFCIG